MVIYRNKGEEYFDMLIKWKKQKEIIICWSDETDKEGYICKRKEDSIGSSEKEETIQIKTHRNLINDIISILTKDLNTFAFSIKGPWHLFA